MSEATKLIYRIRALELLFITIDGKENTDVMLDELAENYNKLKEYGNSYTTITIQSKINIPETTKSLIKKAIQSKNEMGRKKPEMSKLSNSYSFH